MFLLHRQGQPGIVFLGKYFGIGKHSNTKINDLHFRCVVVANLSLDKNKMACEAAAPIFLVSQFYLIDRFVISLTTGNRPSPFESFLLDHYFFLFFECIEKRVQE